jgi:20S proteasome alpha/beta subunit
MLGAPLRPFQFPSKPRVIPRRLPERKPPVTIAVGIICKEGLVVAADAQETAKDFMKTDANKILFDSSRHSGAIVIAGAGRASYVEKIADEWFQWYVAHDTLELLEVKAHFEKSLVKFYRDHVLPFHGDRPDFALIIGMQRNGEELLLASDLNAIREVQRTVSIGIGEVFAHTLLNLYVSGWLRFSGSVDAAAKIAAYVVLRVKGVIDTCGSFTHVVTAKAGQIHAYNEIEIEHWEQAFREFDQMTAYLLQHIVAGTNPPMPFQELIDALKEDLPLPAQTAPGAMPSSPSPSSDPEGPPIRTLPKRDRKGLRPSRG